MAKKIEFQKPNKLKNFISDLIEFTYSMIILFLVIAFFSIIENL